MKKLVLFALLMCSVVASCDTQNYCELDEAGNLTILVQNRTNYELLTGANCTIDIWDSNYTLITDDAVVTEIGSGRYYYQINGSETNTTGLHEYLVNCSYDSYKAYVFNSYEIAVSKPTSYLDEILGYITNATSILYENILNYLDGQLTTVISDSEKQEISENVWNTTVNPDREVTGNPQCKNRPIYNAVTGRWETEC